MQQLSVADVLSRAADLIEPEVWRDIPGTNGRFEASSVGRVRRKGWVSVSGRRRRDGSAPLARKITEKIVTARPDRDGYLRFSIGNTTMGVHRAVCMAFHGEPPEEGSVCRHFDDDKRNNTRGNLGWGSVLQNAQDAIRNNRLSAGEQHYAARLTLECVAAIRSSPLSHSRLAKEHGVHPGHIRAIRAGKKWKRAVAHQAQASS